VKKIELPAVEKGVPLPTGKLRDQRNTPKSPWPDYLKALVPGDSFVLFYPTLRHVMAIAAWMSIPLIKQDLPKDLNERMAKGRIWRVAYEHDYSI
jgi:hypothetical protein